MNSMLYCQAHYVRAILEASAFPYRTPRGVHAFQLPARAIARQTVTHLPSRRLQSIVSRRFYTIPTGQPASPKPSQLLGHKSEDLRQWVDEKAEESRGREHRRRMRDSNPPHRGKYALCDALEDVDNTLDVLEDVWCVFDHDIEDVKNGGKTVNLDENGALCDAIDMFGYAVVGLDEVIDERVPVVMNNVKEERTQTHESYISQDKYALYYALENVDHILADMDNVLLLFGHDIIQTKSSGGSLLQIDTLELNTATARFSNCVTELGRRVEARAVHPPSPNPVHRDHHPRFNFGPQHLPSNLSETSQPRRRIDDPSPSSAETFTSRRRGKLVKHSYPGLSDYMQGLE